MFKSIAEDIRSSFDYGNMVVKLIIINVAVFVVTALTQAFVPQFYAEVLPYIALPGDPMLLLYRPWTLITHMFLHSGLWHLIWNMLVFYWFGNIVGDLIGDKRILPSYLFGGLFGALAYLIFYQINPGVGQMALGASAAVLAVVFMAVFTAPDYLMSLILIGEVRIKFIGFFILFIDLIGLKGNDNSGGHAAHLGGFVLGFLFIYLLRKGIDIGEYFYKLIGFFKINRDKTIKKKPNLKVAHRSETFGSPQKTTRKTPSNDTSEVDKILEKIKRSGYDSLTDIEKEILFKASKN